MTTLRCTDIFNRGPRVLRRLIPELILNSEFRITHYLDDSPNHRLIRRWHFCAVPSARQFAIEEHVATHPEHAVTRTPAIAERRPRRQADRRPAVSDDERRNGDLQAIE